MIEGQELLKILGSPDAVHAYVNCMFNFWSAYLENHISTAEYMTQTVQLECISKHGKWYW